MTNNRIIFALCLTVAFLVGCVAQSVMIPPAAAGSDVQKWEHLCVKVERAVLSGPGETTEALNKAGAQGWELATSVGDYHCLKRSL